MILIIESGATKTSWIFIEDKKEVFISESPGMSPYFQTLEEISIRVASQCLPYVDRIESVFYYGTGVDTEQNRQIIRRGFLNALPQCNQMEVHADILAAARSSCQHQRGLVCILGTGSNACAYDGKKITDNKRGFGFILGDYGSGAVLGKQLVSIFLHNELPDHLLKSWEEAGFETEHAVILKNTYKGAFPSRYLADFSRFAYRHKKDPFIQDLLNYHFKKFFDHQLIPLASGKKDWPIYFVGSIGFYFQEILISLSQAYGLITSGFLSNPADGLVRFHLS
jgi:glucosamine kinase